MSEEVFVQTEKCVLCDGLLDVKRDKDGKIYWTKGNSALPLSEGRCCDDCNWTLVLPARLRGMNI